jgi:predicted MPP superfamily phosphohydrolase
MPFHCPTKINPMPYLKFDIFSDLHLDSWSIGKMPKQSNDICILAGDLCNAPSFTAKMQQFLAAYTKVLYVAGNHEYYEQEYAKPGSHLLQCLNLRDAYPGFIPLHLMPDPFEIEGYLFFGRTLWWGDMNPLEELAIRDQINDLNYIRNATVSGIREHGVQDKEDISRFLLDFSGKKKVVVTHHAPCELSVSAAYKGHAHTPAFVNDCSGLILDTAPHVWIHGHMHSSSDYVLGVTRVIANPLGTAYYPNKDFTDEPFEI